MNNAAESSSVYEYARVVWNRRWVVILATVAALVVALAYGAVATKQYSATADLELSPLLPTGLVQVMNPLAAQSLVDVPTNIEVITSDVVATQVARMLGKPAPSVAAAQIGTSDVVAITVQSTSPSLARDGANAYASAYLTLQRQQLRTALEQASQILQQRLTAVQNSVTTVSGEITGISGNLGVQAELASVQSTLELEQATLQNQLATYQTYIQSQALDSGQIITPAGLPITPSKPKTNEYALLAALIGLVLGVGIVLGMQALSVAGAPGGSGGYGVEADPRPGSSGAVREATDRAEAMPVSTALGNDAYFDGGVTPIDR